MTDDVDSTTPEEAEEIMDAMRYAGRFTALAAGRELLRLNRRVAEAEKSRDEYRERCRAMLPSRHRQRHLKEMLLARKELADLRVAAKLAIEETIRRPMGVVPDSAVECLKMIGGGE